MEFTGTSNMTHEVDVSIIRAADAIKRRLRPGDLPAACLVGAWECKHYYGRLDKVLGRAFVGLMDDMGSNPRMSGLASNSAYPELRLYLRPQRRPDPNFGLTPTDPESELIFVNAIKAQLKKMTCC